MGGEYDLYDGLRHTDHCTQGDHEQLLAVNQPLTSDRVVRFQRDGERCEHIRLKKAGSPVALAVAPRSSGLISDSG
jgi:hypothetical protein